MHLQLLITLFIPVLFCHENVNPLLNRGNDDHALEENMGAKKTSRTGRQMPKIMEDEGSHAHEHIKEHLDGQIDTEMKLTNEELQFKFFKIHDLDNNDLLDGIELFKAIAHRSVEFKEKNSNVTEIEIIVDNVLLNDLNNDGYLSYVEFLETGNSS